MHIVIVAALADNRVIGSNNKLPWHLPKDLQHFRQLTLGGTIIMGRKTYDSIGKALPFRRNIVLSREKKVIPNCEVYASLEEALLVLDACSEIFIIGGTEVYEQALPLAGTMYLTLVHHSFVGDAYFPQWNTDEWRLVERQDFRSDGDNVYAYSFLTLKRKGVVE